MYCQLSALSSLNIFYCHLKDKGVGLQVLTTLVTARPLLTEVHCQTPLSSDVVCFVS